MTINRITIWKKRLLTAVYSVAIFFTLHGTLLAQEEKKDDSEPIWVISWAIFYLFLALTIVLLVRQTGRKDTIFNEEELKQYEEALAAKLEALRPVEEETDDDD